MAVQPPEEAIISFIDATSLQRSNAIAWLKANNNDINNAVNAYYDGNLAPLPPPQINETYSEQQFHTDRQGNMPQSQMEASFGGNDTNTLDPSVFSHDPAPSRPPSRVDNKKTTQPHGPQNNPLLASEGTYEEQIRKATEMSLSESQTLPGQVTGITDGSPYFGPPTQSHYEKGKWTLTIPEANTQEILLSPEPPDRKRKPGTPAFLKPTSASRNLPALLKILHTIPIAREALLNRSHLLNDYGRESEWWDGTPIRSLRVVNVDESSPELPLNDVIYETQRLMAFLDGTDRAYGSADALANLPAMRTTLESDSVGPAYLETWKNITLASAVDTSLSNIFSSTGTRRVSEDVSLDDHEYFTCFQIRVDSETADKGFSMYEAIDDLIWADSSETFLDEVGDIISFEIQNTAAGSKGLGVSVPSVWYADRYLESSIPEAKKMIDRKEAIFAEAHGAKKLRKLMTQIKMPGGAKDLDAGQVMNKTVDYLKNTSEYRHDTTDRDSNHSTAPLTNYTPLTEELAKLTKKIVEKLAALEEMQESVCQRIMEASKLFKESSDDPLLSPTHRYTLRGVRTNPHTIYVLERSPTVADDSMLESSPKEYAWWKIEYNASSSDPVQVDQITEDEVLIAASTECRNVLLVYASDHAVSYDTAPLPPQLENFVRTDNRAFQAEVDSYITQNHGGDFDPPAIPKRKVNATDDSDLEVEYDRSPNARSSIDAGSESSSPFDPNPPTDPFASDEDYDYETRPRAPPQKLRPLEPKPRPTGSTDDHIPVSLRGGQEMQESGSGGDLLRSYGGKYKPSGYASDVRMDDDDEGYAAEEEGQGKLGA